jgi:lysophospholipid acyltransferase (LPLAT)-like uncharacterized protein
MVRNKLLARILWIVVFLWSKTIRFRTVNMEVRKQFLARGENCIFAFWHGSLLMLLQAHHDSDLLIPVSESRDGEFITRVITNFGFEVARGSSKRKGDKALLSLISKMRKGKNVGITVDGPRGPLHKVKKGVAFLAGVSKTAIVPVATAARRSWILKRSWDKLVIPLPFTQGLIMLGDPIYVSGTSDQEIAFIQKQLEAELKRLTRLAHEDISAAGRDARISQHGK